jgi:dihydrofolate synthase/folylpolyglutamate synthase
VIHVAGTNGKGSTVAFVRAIAEAAGLRVHVLTSPHLVRFVERIRISGELISDEALAETLARVEAANAGQPITFFEITTAAALLAFSQTPADLCVIEVGLGGRYDATNVIRRPAVSVIAPVDHDHREFLGDDLGRIAGEKAGIIKPGRPVVSARQQPVAEAAILAEAEAVHAPLAIMGQDFDAWGESGRLIFSDEQGLEDLPGPALAGEHQVANAGLAIAALRRLDDLRITSDNLGAGVASAAWPARFQRLTAGPYGRQAQERGADLWLDGAHNPHAARAAAAELARLARDGRPIRLITGLLANKDAAGFYAAFAGLPAEVLAIGFDAEAAADPAVLAAAATAAGLPAHALPGLELALDAALAVQPAPHILICGSLYLAGEVLAASPQTWPH